MKINITLVTNGERYGFINLERMKKIYELNKKEINESLDFDLLNEKGVILFFDESKYFENKTSLIINSEDSIIHLNNSPMLKQRNDKETSSTRINTLKEDFLNFNFLEKENVEYFVEDVLYEEYNTTIEIESDFDEKKLVLPVLSSDDRDYIIPSHFYYDNVKYYLDFVESKSTFEHFSLFTKKNILNQFKVKK